MTIKNRGACSNPSNRFEIKSHEKYDDGWENIPDDEEVLPALETILYPEKAKKIISRNDSPDIPFEQSINPYRGCEHGCIYCYARPSHNYMNLSSGLDFETKLFYKVDAAKILENEINHPKYECKSITLGANTDPYQPIESKLNVTRDILEILNRHHHPVTIITKSSLIERDFELIQDMAKRNLISVAVSVTTLKTDLKRILEPRTSSPRARLKTLGKFAEAGIPVRVMVAPMIPMINDMEMEQILKAAADMSVKQASYTFIRLPYDVKDLFKEWLNNYFPDRAKHVMSIIKQMRNGQEYDSDFSQRMRGTGLFADLLERRFRLACQRFNINLTRSQALDHSQFKKNHHSSSVQMDMFSL